MSYKKTLNLPRTDFPMKANLAQREPAIRQFWQEQQITQALQQDKQDAPRFLLHDGPPYANGDIHVGHALNKILKDFIIKSKNLSGYQAPFVPGWDCHGLPVELKVEKKHGKRLAPAEFRQACRQYAQSQLELQRESFQLLGLLGDWTEPYVTMDHRYEAQIIRALADLLEAGYLQPGFKPVFWCLDCQSALAEAEVVYQDKTSLAVDVHFMVCEPDDLWQRVQHTPEINAPVSIPIWTTTVWTLPANQAVAVHPDQSYSLVRFATADGWAHAVVGTELMSELSQRWQVTFDALQIFPGRVLEHLSLQHPFEARQVPVVLGEHVTMEAGTGAVHTAPGHGEDDHRVGLRYQLPLEPKVDARGCYVDSVPDLAGMHLSRVTDDLIAKMQAHGTLQTQQAFSHSYPHCWRHHQPVIFRATRQWFVRLAHQRLRERSIESIAQVEWLPTWGEARLSQMIQNRPDWCVSRQRLWGTPLALVVHRDQQTLHPKATTWMRQTADRIEQQGLEAWSELDLSSWLGDEASDYEKCTDILDVWFESGISHQAVLAQRPGLTGPADLYLEGSDQHRGWFQTSLLTAMALTGQPPYRQVITHGYIVDKRGDKMSKSKGNVLSPRQVVKTQGADVLRLWVASTDYQQDIVISDEVLARIGEAYRRIRNTARYLLSNLFDLTPADLLPFDQLLSLDRWILQRARQVQQAIIDGFDQYQFHRVYQKLYHFCTVDLGGLYLDITKDRQYTCQANSRARRSTQTAMYHLLSALVRWMAPILSHTAEELWRFIPQDDDAPASVLLSRWYEHLPMMDDPDVFAQWQRVMAIREVVNKALEHSRQQGLIGSGLDATIDVYLAPSDLALLQPWLAELHLVFIVSAVHLKPREQAPPQADEVGSDVICTVEPSPHPKCERCWHRTDTVGSCHDHPTLCARCVLNIDGDGEIRHWV